MSAVLPTQENSYEYDRVMSGLEEQWPNRRLFQRDHETKKSHAHHSDGWSSEPPSNNDKLGEWECSEDEQTDESAWSFWPEHDTWNGGWDESYWDDTSQ